MFGGEGGGRWRWRELQPSQSGQRQAGAGCGQSHQCFQPVEEGWGNTPALDQGLTKQGSHSGASCGMSLPDAHKRGLKRLREGGAGQQGSL